MTAPDQASPTGQDTPPTSNRHPGRQTRVSCVRCGRHACPDCQRDAAVGQQCIDCVRGTGQGGQPARAAKTVFGGRPSRSATVTWTLMAVNILLYLVLFARPSLVYDWGMLGYDQLSPGGPMRGVAAGEWYRLITSAFVAPGTSTLGILDIAFNMWALYLVGPGLEQLLGRVRFLAVYLLSAVGGSVLLYYLAPQMLAAGASGAIFGLFGAWFVASRKLRLDSRGIVLLIVLNLGLSFVYRSTIAWQDHVGGLIVGAVVMAAYAYAPRKDRAALQVTATVAVAVLLAVAVMIRTGQLTA